ncbi:hypothetical protein SKAU_G00066160 [Synaphobranchus kaupii]|uniref:Uncharacterized protein n=1 Tax=Synaphobranchus kaupii TaxID=118154 RepID=A0A9Q1JA38_SYNKA|nr:hypothetical protein SKAU_G00066160 [Synaphobranchus kaupii]
MPSLSLVVTIHSVCVGHSPAQLSALSADGSVLGAQHTGVERAHLSTLQAGLEVSGELRDKDTEHGAGRGVETTIDFFLLTCRPGPVQTPASNPYRPLRDVRSTEGKT